MLNRRCCTLVVSAMLTASILSAPAVSHAQDIDALIAEIEQVSRDVSAQTEEVKAIEVDILERESTIEAIRDRQAHHRQLADKAHAVADSYRGEINRIAQARYRGAAVDPLTVAISGENPQHVIDRISYIASLTESTGEVAAGLSAATDEASDNLDEANRMKAEAEFQLGQLRVHLGEQLREQDELDRRQDEIRRQVDNLTPEQRQLWVQKNGPLDIEIVDFLGSSGEAAGAVQAALGKIGSPYGWGAVGPSAFDCSGLIYWAFQQQGKTLPRTSQAQMAGGTPVDRDQLQPGDVIGYYPGATHVGLYIGNGMIVHASDYGIPVQVVSVDSAPFFGARRY